MGEGLWHPIWEEPAKCLEDEMHAGNSVWMLALVSDRMARNLRLPVGMVRIEVKGRWVNSFLGRSGLSMIYQLLEMFSASMTACCTVQGVIVTRAPDA